MKKTFTEIYTNKKMPYLELRYSNSNEHYKKHFHNTFSIGVNKEGKSIYTNEKDKYLLDKNMLSIINPKYVHSCNSCTNILNIFYMMYLDKKWCYNIQKLIKEDINEFINIPVSILEDKSFYKRYIELCEILFLDISVYEKENELINFMLDFFSLYLGEINVNKTDKVFENIRDYIDINYKQNIQLEDLSKVFNLNKFYIIRLFKANMNLTPHSYLINTRVNEAKKLLKEGISIIETAQECGFFDQSHFHRNFYKITTTTPKEYQVNFIQ